MSSLAINLGTLNTNNIFFVEDIMYAEILEEKQYVINHPGGVVSYKLVQSSAFLSWNYKTGVKLYIDAKTFRTQLTLFKYFKDTREDYMDTLTEELLDYDLCNIAIRSEHLF